jgi:hypothetical protein
MASVFISSPAEVVIIDSRTRSGTVTLPLTNSIPYRILNFKDQYGTFSNSTLTLSTQNGETFDDGATSKVFSNAFTYASLYATSSKWMVLNATQTVQQTISSLNVNQINFGSGAGWIQFGPIQAPIVSTIQLNTNTGYINNLLLGNNSNVTALQYWGTSGNYNNTILAEISTGGLSQEFLIFKGSTTSDRVRVQTTGTFVVETGVGSRVWGSDTTSTLSNATPAFIINTSSNVGIQTATPQTALDVAGTARAQILSSLALQTSSINGMTFGTPISTVALFTSNTSNYYANLLQNWSTPDSTIALFTSNTSNFFANATSGAGVSSLFAVVSTGLSTVALFTSNTSNFYRNVLQDFSTPLLSTTAGLGTATYISSSQLVSSLTSILTYYRSLSVNISTLTTSNLTGITGYVSSLTVDSLQFGTGNGWIDIGPIRTVAVSTIQINVDTVYANVVSSGSFLGDGSQITNLPAISSLSLQSTVRGLGTAGYLSTISQATLFTSNTSNYYRNLLQDWSTPNSTVAAFTSNTSNFFANNAGGAGTSSLLGTISSGFSTLGLFTSNTSNYYSNLQQNWSTPLSTVAAFTSNTSNFFTNNAGGAGTSSLLGVISSGFSTLGLFTSNTSNYYGNLLQNYSTMFSTAVSTVALFTSNTSNFYRNTVQDWSTQQNTIYAFTSNTSNYYSNLLLYDASTVIRSSFQSTVANLGFAGYISSSQLISSVEYLLSNSGGASQTVINSTIVGLGTFQYISSLSLQSTVTNILNTAAGVTQQTLTSSLIGLGTFGYISSMGNVTSTFFVNSDNAIILPSYASYTISSGYQYVSAPWGSDLAPLNLTRGSYSQMGFSTANNYLSYTGSNQQDFRITYTCGGNDRDTNTKPTLTLLISDPVSGIAEYQTINANEVAGASASLIKTLSQSNTLYFFLRGLSNYTFTSNDSNMYQINIESIQPLTVDTFSSIRISSLSLYDPSTFTYRAITISAGSIYVDGNLAGASGSGGTALTSIPSSLSTFAMFTSSLRASTVQANTIFASTIQVSTLYASTAIISSLVVFTENVSSLNVSTLSSFFTNTSTLTTTQINFGSGFGYLVMPDVQPNTVYTSTVTTSNLFIGFNSNQSYAGFFGAGAYQNSVIFESNIGSSNQELAFFRGASATDRIRLQTTGYIVFEPGVASRSFPSVGSNATPAMVITTASNVGIQNFAPSFPLDVTGTARATTSFSTLLVQTSNIQTTNFTTTTINAISSFVNSAIVSNAFFVNGSTFLQGGVSTSFLMGSVGEVRLNTSNTTRMYITSAGNIGIGLTNPSYQVHITSNLYASSMVASSIFASSITSYLTLSSVQTFTSSLTGNTLGATNMVGSHINASTFTGRWNDAVYFTLQEI